MTRPTPTTVSFFADNTHPAIVEYQRRVFDHFGLTDHLQIRMPIDHGDASHGRAIDHFLAANDHEHLAIFDVDAIPLSSAWVHYYDPAALVGGAQHSAHIAGSTPFVSPAWMMFSRTLWSDLGRPGFAPTRGVWDTGEEFTTRARERGRGVVLVWPSDVEVVKPEWNLLGGDTPVGYGLTWGGAVYHAYNGRAVGRSTDLFLRRCLRVLDRPPVSIERVQCWSAIVAQKIRFEARRRRRTRRS